MHVLRDPEGFGHMLALADEAALIALLMDGRRTLPEIQAAFSKKVGVHVEPAELEAMVPSSTRPTCCTGRASSATAAASSRITPAPRSARPPMPAPPTPKTPTT